MEIKRRDIKLLKGKCVRIQACFSFKEKTEQQTKNETGQLF